jgi:hypothetical protein
MNKFLGRLRLPPLFYFTRRRQGPGGDPDTGVVQNWDGFAVSSAWAVALALRPISTAACVLFEIALMLLETSEPEA